MSGKKIVNGLNEALAGDVRFGKQSEVVAWLVDRAWDAGAYTDNERKYFRQAADLIERLQRDLFQSDLDRQEFQRENERLKDEIVRLRGTINPSRLEEMAKAYIARHTLIKDD